MIEPVCRDYQLDCIDEITTSAAHGNRRIVAVMPCGAGKTIVAGKIIQNAVKNGQRVLFLAHRRELIWQTQEKLASFGVESTVLIPDEPYDPSALACIASIQTLHARAMRRKTLSLPKSDLVICDEFAHAFSSGTWQKILASYSKEYILGLTATPINRCGEGMAHCADAMVLGPSIQQLIDLGHLVPARYFCPSLPDLQKLKIQAGDYVQNQLEEHMDKPKLIGDILENWSRICPTEKTIVFASGVKHSIHIAEGFKSLGVSAEHIDGDTPSEDRDKIISKFRRGEIQVISNCAVLTEGFDDPSASALVFARPTKSLMLYLQVAGRVLRPSPGKNRATILDHAGVLYEHGPVNQSWDWKLEYGEQKTIGEAMRRKKKQAKPITCKNCKCVYEKRLDCPNCGVCPTINGRAVPTIEAYLQELEADDLPKAPDRKQFYCELMAYAREHNYKPGWAFFKYQERFGVHPGTIWRNLEPIMPSLETKSWLRSRQIAWAKSRRNPANA